MGKTALTEAPVLPARYRLLARIARGGMGEVWQAQDTNLDRMLAVKMMLPESARHPDLVIRFEREAQIVGKLQHPGIPPVVEQGSLADGLPFFSMKLVQGRTLAELLSERSDPAAGLAQLILVFEQVCQAVGYAHSQGVIHRDLKPANVMIGAFGEVQLVDWGTARWVGEPESPYDPEASTHFFTSPDALHPDEGTSDTKRGDDSVTLTRAGQVLGTIAYMPPEQAQGHIGSLDPRTDVFALGGVLCKLLTGRPPYVGNSPAVLYDQALAGRLDDAFGALDASGADAELVALAKSCLSPNPSDRPADGAQVAKGVQAYRAAVEERLAQAKLERTAAKIRAEEEAKRARIAASRTRAVLALAAAVLLVVLGGGAALWWYQEDRARQRREAESRTEQIERDVTDAIARAAELREDASWEAAETLLAGVEGRLEGAGEPRLSEALTQAERNLAMARRLEEVRLQMATLTNDGFHTGFATSAQGAYANALRSYGLDIVRGDLARMTESIADSPIKDRLIAALDHWGAHETDQALRDRVFRVARGADPDPLLDRLRSRHIAQDKDVFAELARQADPQQLSAATLQLIAVSLVDAGKLDEARSLLRRSILYHPSDFWLHFELAQIELASDRAQHELAVVHYSSALAARPSAFAALNNLGVALDRVGRSDEAEASFRRAIEMDPDYAGALFNLGNFLRKAGRNEEAAATYRRAIEVQPDFAGAHVNLGILLGEADRSQEAEAAYRRAIEIGPDYASAHFHLGILLHESGRNEQAEAAYRRTLEIQPDYADAYYNLGNLLRDIGRDEEAVASYRRAIELKPDLAKAHTNLGTLLSDVGSNDEAEASYRRAIETNPDDTVAHLNLGHLLRETGRNQEAEASFRRAIEIEPDLAEAHDNLGIVLSETGRIEAAEASFRRAIAIQPDLAEAHANLGVLLHTNGRNDQAEASYRRAIEIDPDYAKAHLSLGILLSQTGRIQEAEASYRRAIQIDPASAEAHCNLGLLLVGSGGRFSEAVQYLKRGHELGSARDNWLHPSAEWLKQAQELAELDQELAGVLDADNEPLSADHALRLAEFALVNKAQPLAAARLFSGALDEPAVTASDRFDRFLYKAACAAALSSAGQLDAQELEPSEREKWRGQAYTWLSELFEHGVREHLSGDAEGADGVPDELRQWQTEPDLATVRDGEHLATLPATERPKWERLWQDIADAIAKGPSTNPADP